MHKSKKNKFKNNFLNLNFCFLNRKLIDPAAIPIIEYIAADVDSYLPYPFNEEIKGLHCTVFWPTIEFIFTSI